MTVTISRGNTTITLDDERIDGNLNKELNVIQRAKKDKAMVQDFLKNTFQINIVAFLQDDASKTAQEKLFEIINAAQSTGGIWQLTWGSQTINVAFKNVQFKKEGGQSKTIIVIIQLVESEA